MATDISRRDLIACAGAAALATIVPAVSKVPDMPPYRIAAEILTGADLDAFAAAWGIFRDSHFHVGEPEFERRTMHMSVPLLIWIEDDASLRARLLSEIAHWTGAYERGTPPSLPPIDQSPGTRQKESPATNDC